VFISSLFFDRWKLVEDQRRIRRHEPELARRKGTAWRWAAGDPGSSSETRTAVIASTASTPRAQSRSYDLYGFGARSRTIDTGVFGCWCST
jgi:hypothetical protein